MANTFIFNKSYEDPSQRTYLRESSEKERSRREDSIRCVMFWRDRLMKMYTPLVANEMLSLLFRQRGVPSVDCFTYEIIHGVRVALGFSDGPEDTLRRILKLGSWYTGEYSITMWTIEPVVASMHIMGNDVDLNVAKEKYLDQIEMVDMLTTKTHRCNVIDNNMRGRWSGWIAWKGHMDQGGSKPYCVSCNICGPSFMFAFCTKDTKVIQLMMTPTTIMILSTYCRRINTEFGVTVHQITSSSTKLKIQNGLERARSTHLTLYGNGSMQFNGSPKEIVPLYKAALEIVKMAMSSELGNFMSSLRRADKTEA